MPWEWIEAAHFSPDALDFIRMLDEFKVRYVIVGGEAVIFHGHVRLTGDVDFFYDLEPGNIEALHQALVKFWSGHVPGLETAAELREAGVILQFGVPPNRIDLLNQVDGLSFADAWRNRITAMIKGDEGETPVYYLGLKELVRNKQAAARPKDLDDIKYLRRASRE